MLTVPGNASRYQYGMSIEEEASSTRTGIIWSKCLFNQQSSPDLDRGTTIM